MSPLTKIYFILCLLYLRVLLRELHPEHFSFYVQRLLRQSVR